MRASSPVDRCTARLYLDVDGCLSPLPPERRGPDGWAPPDNGWAWVDPQAFNSTPMPTTVLADLQQFATTGVEAVWATSWPIGMIGRAVDKVGFPVRIRHLNVDGCRAKLDDVRDDVERCPTPFVWIEDSYMPTADRWARRLEVPSLIVRPNRYEGITPAMWAEVKQWLARCRQFVRVSLPVPNARSEQVWADPLDDSAYRIVSDPVRSTIAVRNDIVSAVERRGGLRSTAVVHTCGDRVTRATIAADLERWSDIARKLAAHGCRYVRANHNDALIVVPSSVDGTTIRDLLADIL